MSEAISRTLFKFAESFAGITGTQEKERGLFLFPRKVFFQLAI